MQAALRFPQLRPYSFSWKNPESVTALGLYSDVGTITTRLCGSGWLGGQLSPTVPMEVAASEVLSVGELEAPACTVGAREAFVGVAWAYPQGGQLAHCPGLG